MDKRLRIALLAVFSLIFVVSAVMLIYEGIEYKKNEEVYNQAQEVAGLPNMDNLGGTIKPIGTGDSPSATEDPLSPDGTGGSASAPGTGDESVTTPVTLPEYDGPDPYMEVLSGLDLAALKKQNSDVIGWIYITDSKVNYPIVYYTDNDYYLYRNYLKQDNKGGSIFLETNCSPAFSDFNTVIYGHRMKNRSMFGSLVYYKGIQYWSEHPNVYIVTESGVRKYVIFAAYEVPTDGTTYRLAFADDNEKQSFINYASKRSVIKTGLKPTVADDIITLSTCSASGYETRWVVQAYSVDYMPRQ